MHKLVKIEEYDVTRHVTLKNLETGTEDYCFDDSDMVALRYNPKDFWFMEVGKKYDCKIVLFGCTGFAAASQRVLCQVVRDNVICGKARLVEVSVNGDRYYIPRFEVEDEIKNGEFYYSIIRKDLIQVDNVIHGDLLH